MKEKKNFKTTSWKFSDLKKNRSAQIKISNHGQSRNNRSKFKVDIMIKLLNFKNRKSWNSLVRKNWINKYDDNYTEQKTSEMTKTQWNANFRVDTK